MISRWRICLDWGDSGSSSRNSSPFLLQVDQFEVDRDQQQQGVVPSVAAAGGGALGSSSRGWCPR